MFWVFPLGAEDRQGLMRGAGSLTVGFALILCQQGLSVSLLGKVRMKNMYKEGDLTHFNQKLEEFTLPRCWDECLASSQYHARRSEVDKFNR